VSSPTDDGALGSVLGLERALETANATAVDADARIERARHEADGILAAARERAERRAAERESSLIAAADAEARKVRRDAEAAAARLRARVGEVEGEFLDAALALLLPGVDAEAGCSRR
jgi:hypothetical protein